MAKLETMEPVACKTVLVVDDNEDIRSSIKDILDDLGYCTETAHDGPSALRLLSERHYDVAILDYKMPGMDGDRLRREIKRLRPETASIMVTAFAGNDGLRLAAEAGTFPVLPKPLNISELLPLVASAANR